MLCILLCIFTYLCTLYEEGCLEEKKTTFFCFSFHPHSSLVAFGPVNDQNSGEKRLTFDARPHCADKILKQLAAHSAVTALHLFRFKIKDWPPTAAAAPHSFNWSSFYVFSLYLTSCVLCLFPVLALYQLDSLSHDIVGLHVSCICRSGKWKE